MPANFFTTGAVDLFYRSRKGEVGGDPPPAYPYGDGGDFDDRGDQPPGGADDRPYDNYPSDNYRRTYNGSGGGNDHYGGWTATNFGPWRYLGSSVTAPDVEARRVGVPVTTDYNAPAPFQKVFASEYHVVTATLNRLNFRNWNFLRNGLVGDGTDIVRAFKTGRLILHADDVELFVRFVLPHSAPGSQPDGAARGRLYYSAILIDYHETSVNSRVQEVSLVLECNPLFYKRDRLFWLFTERDADLPNLTPE